MNNKSEAKVPNDEGNWQSIEIYLFSNGQQYSPPRKYHLQAEELNWWDATLNHLARSHYGIQHPLIYLYTIDGRLVEGPLELKDGQAYVAVEPPATFIDAGYQKYLIRASRSWEKRQAKKKSQASDHTPPCCTCPDKASYRLPPCCTCSDNDCQLHGTCCLCPEKERAAFLEPLLPATPRRNSPGGQYVSSGHGKPIPPDPPADNGKAAEGEIGVRVGERRSVPCEETLRSGYESGVEESDLTSAGRGQRGVSEAVDKHGHAVSSCKGRGGCTVSSQRDNTVATDDPKENFISILNKGDVVNLKLNIEVRNDQSKKPVNFCQKSSRKSRSLTNITRTEKCSQISIDDDILAQSKSLQSLLNNEYFRGCPSDGRPKILVVQCACCGRSNNSPRDPPRSSDSKKYFVLLPNPHQQDKNERCNCETHGQSNSHKIPPQSQNSTSEHTIKKTLSNISLETLMTKGVSTHRRDLARYVATTNSTCQTEEPKSDCLIAKHRVSITENSGIRCEFQKESHSQISVITPGLVPEINCQNIQQYTCGSKHLDSHVPLDRSNPYAKVQAQLCPEICPDTCPLSPFHVCQPNCPQAVAHTQARPIEHNQGYSKVFPQVQSQGSSQTCQQVQSEGFPQAGQQFQVKECSEGCRHACSQGHLQVHSQTCTQVQSNSFSQAQSQEHPQTCSPTCPKGFPQVYPQIYLQVQSQGCQPSCLQAQSQTSRQKSSQGFPPIRREVSDSDTQTQWCSILLEARLHDDGRYSFHLPPLQVLKYYSF